MVRAILTDIEGTTSSLSFVKDVLFPYAREHMADFIRNHSKAPAVVRLLEDVRQVTGTELDQEQLIRQLIVWIDEDRKITPLKALQGLIWEHGYRHGEFTGHIYPDAVRRLREWQAQGLRLYVYSSGSIQAQQLLFVHTGYGDLTPLFSGYFDTISGPKHEASSYRIITTVIGLLPAEILFLSDSREELDAARQAGLQTVWLVRNGELDSTSAHPQARDFDGIRV